MNDQNTSRPDEAADPEIAALPDFDNVRLQRAALVTASREPQHVELSGDNWSADIRRRLNGAGQPYLSVTFYEDSRQLAETSDMQVIHLPTLDDVLIYRAETQRIDGVPTVVLTLADDYRVLFSAAINEESIGVEFADPGAAVE